MSSIFEWFAPRLSRVDGRSSSRLRAAIMAVCIGMALVPGAAPPAAAQERGQRVDPVERRAYIVEIQRQLKRLDCYAGPVDGRLDRPTLAAVERLRRAVGTRQFARYDLTSLNRRPSAITERQFDAWVARLRALNVRCGSDTAGRTSERDRVARDEAARREREMAERRADAERQRRAEAEAAERMRQQQQQSVQPRTRTGIQRNYIAPKAAPSAGPVGGSGPPSDRDARAMTRAPEPAPGASRGSRGASAPPASSAPVFTPQSAPVAQPAPAQPAVTRSARSAAAPAAASEPYDVVPIFYGTDRLRDDDPKRARYGSVRAKRLELGQALVTVPKIHEKPQVERPWVYHLPFTSIVVWSEKEDPAKHFTIRNARDLTREQFVDLVRQRLGASSSYKDHALVFVHGFNTTFDWALYRAAQISYDLKFDGAMFAYSFPSRGEVSPTAYAYDRESAGQAQGFLEDFLKLVTRETGAKTVSIIAHSMGNQLLLPVLKDLQRSSPPDLKISQVILAAPDVDRDNFELLARQITGVSKGFTLYAAGNDWALRASQKFWGDVPRAGEVPKGGPVVVDGIDTIDVTKTSTEFLSLGHNGYAEKSALLNDIELLIRTGERPPEQRFPILKRVKTTAGAEYWLYP